MPKGRALFIELKAEGRSVSPLQAHWLEELKALGFEAYEVDNFPMFKRILDERLHAAGLDSA